MSFRDLVEDEFSLPLANAHNRQLQLKVRDKRAKLAKLMNEVDQNENEIKVAEQETSTLQQSTVQTNNLAQNVRSQTRKELEALKLANSESSAMDQEHKRLQHLLEQMQEHNERLEKKLSSQANDLEMLNQVFEDEAKIVDVMQKMVESQQEDHSVLEKYSHQDSMALKDLELKLARAKEEFEDVERQIKMARDERENSAIQLQNMQAEFRSMMDDRDQSLRRWDMTLLQSQLCHEQLDQSRKEYQRVKELANVDQNRLDEVNRCVEQLQRDITALERELHSRELVASQLKLKLDDMDRIHNEQQSEYAATEKLVKRLNMEIKTSRVTIRNLKSKLDNIKVSIVEENLKYRVLEQDLENAKSTVHSAHTQKESLSRMSKAADDRLERQRNLLNKLGNECAHTEAEIRKVKLNLSSCETKMRLSLSSLRYLENHIKINAQQIKQRDEVIYKKNMEILRMELELRKLRGCLGDMEERKLQREKIEELRKELDSGNAYLIALRHELSKTESDLIGLQRGCDIQQQRKNVLEAMTLQLQSECMSRERECTNLRRELEELRMGESLIHLEIKRRECMIQTKSTALEHLGNQKRAIENAIETRREELANQMEVLQLENRTLKERTQQLAIEVNQKAAEIERIKTRYDVVANTLTHESEAEEASEAYFIIKMAQEKELLKEAIGELENLVTKLESDNTALGNTYRLIACCNQQFRQHTIIGVLTDDDKALKNKMEQDKEALDKAVSALKKEIAHETQQMERLEEEIRQLKEQAYRAKFSVEEKEIQLNDATEEFEKIKSKINRALDTNLIVQKSVRRARRRKEKMEEETDFEIGQLRERCQSSQSMMLNATKHDMAAKTKLATYLEELASGMASSVALLSENKKDLLKPIIVLSPSKTRLDVLDFPSATGSSSRASNASVE